MKEQKIDLSNKTVLVTGANGYIGSHCVKALLQLNCKVKGTVRSLKQTERNKALQNLVPQKLKNLELVEADLLDKQIWFQITKNIDFVLHIASPVFANPIKDGKEEIKTALEGTQNVLEACLQNNITKIVLTSSIASIVGQNNHKSSHYTNQDWTDENFSHPYHVSKTKAEKFAWQFAIKNNINLTTILPGLVLGNYLLPSYTQSMKVIETIFKQPGILNLSFNTVSIDAVVAAHIKSLQYPNISKLKRYVLVENTYWYGDMMNIIKEEFERFGYQFWSFRIPYFILWIVSYCKKEL